MGENLRAFRRFGRVTESKLERWYGSDVMESLRFMATGLTVPTPIMGVPAGLYQGGIVPRIAGGAGFASLSDLISEATANGKSQTLCYQKVGVTGPAVAASQPLWNVGNLPQAGGVGGTSGTGSVPTNSTTGSFKQTDPAGGDTLHLTTWTGVSTVAGSVLLWDRFWHMTYNHASATTTAVDASNRPTRHQTSALAPGNFISLEVTTVLSATAHTLTPTYVDQDGNTAEAASTALTVRVSSAVQTIGMTAPQWTFTLNAGDTGVRYLTSIGQSTITSVTGVSSFVLGSPIAILPQPAANTAFVLDGINSAFNLAKIEDGSCLCLNEFFKTATTSATVAGCIQLVSG